MRADRVKRSQNVQLAAGYRGSIAKCEYLRLHGKLL